MNRYRFLGSAAYIVAATLIVLPLFDAALSLSPWVPASGQWRFAAIGLITKTLVLPGAGLLVALACGIALGQYRGLRLLGMACGIGAGLLVMLMVLFAIDAAQLGANVDPAAVRSFNVVSFATLARLLIATVTLIALARAALRSSNDRRNAHIPAPARPPLTTNVR